MTVNEPRILRVIERRGSPSRPIDASTRRWITSPNTTPYPRANVVSDVWPCFSGGRHLGQGEDRRVDRDELRVELAKRATELTPFFQLEVCSSCGWIYPLA